MNNNVALDYSVSMEVNPRGEHVDLTVKYRDFTPEMIQMLFPYSDAYSPFPLAAVRVEKYSILLPEPVIFNSEHVVPLIGVLRGWHGLRLGTTKLAPAYSAKNKY